MEFNLEQLKDMVRFCGGDVKLVDGYLEMLKNKPITTLKELIDCIDKTDYSFIVSRAEVPKFREYLDDWEMIRYRRYDLEEILESLADKAYGEHMDDEDYNEDLTQEELVDKYFPEIAKELIDLRFGSMEYDW